VRIQAFTGVEVFAFEPFPLNNMGAQYASSEEHMKGLTGNLLRYVPLLLAAAAPLHAQFTTTGCPGGNTSIQLNGFTAGTTADSDICLTGTFQAGLVYNITLTRKDTSGSTMVTASAGGKLIVASVPASFYSLTSSDTQVVPVSISIFAPQLSGTSQTGSFQINPPLTNGGPVFVSAVNAPVIWTLFNGGTPPYQQEFNSGNAPNGMQVFPSTGNTWSGTPSQSGVFTFTTIPTDAWGNEITTNESAYVLPVPQITSINPTTVTAGSQTTTVTITGTNFATPQTIQGTGYPAATVQIGQGSNPATLIPSSVSAGQITVDIPSSSLINGGLRYLSVNNLGYTSSNQALLQVEPVITALSTYTRTAGTPAFTLTVAGAGFEQGAQVLMNGSILATTFVNSSTLNATFPTVNTPATVSITVENVDETISASVGFTVEPQPTIGGLNPSSANQGGAAFSLNVTGSHFLSGMTVYFNGSPLSTALVNNMLTAAVPASAIASPGVVPVAVVTADNFSTASLPFTIISTGPPPLQLTTFSPLPSGVVNTPYTYNFTATAGAGGYTFAVTGGALPAGLQLSAAGVLSGTPTAIGSSQFTVQVTDSAGATAARIYTLNITPQPLTLTTGPLANTVVNIPLNIQFAGAGGVPPYTFVEFGALPAGTQFSSAGLLSGTPTAMGSYPFLVFINDSNGASASKNYTLTVAQPGVLITQASPLPPGQVYVNYSTQLTAIGGVGAPYTWAATGLPAGLNIANNSGLIDGIPTAIGTFSVTVTAKDHNGSTATQTYTLVIASTTLTIVTPSLANGAVGSPYSAVLNASGGSGTYTYTATGLPPGVTLSPSGTFSGTPSTAGPYTIAVTATDANGVTASASFKVTIAAKLVVNPVTIPTATQGVAIAPVTLTATGGTPPYTWQSATLPPGLTLSSSGTLSGTPTVAGSYTFTVYAVDNSGALSSGTDQLTVALPSAPAASITGLPAASAPAQQPSLQVTLSGPYPAPITANLTLTFAPVSGADDPSIQFSTGGRTAQIVIPAGATVGPTSVGIQTGTVAGTITITAQLLVNGVNVTPTPVPKQTVTVNPSAPVITRVTATRTSTGFTVAVTGYASNRDVDSGTFQFAASEGANLQTTQLTTTTTSLFTQWYGSSTSAPYGSQFTLTQPFTVNGTSSSVLSVTVTLTNALGTSPAITAILQ
jgi:hypothetical protein